MKLKALGKLVSGKLVGDQDVEIKGVAAIEDAASGDLTFILAPKFLAPALQSKATAFVAYADAKVQGRPAILVNNPRLAMAQLLPEFAPKIIVPKGIHKTAVVPKGCAIGEGVAIGPYVVLGEDVSIGRRTVIQPHTYIGTGSVVGDDCIIHSNVSIYDQTKIGNRVIIHSGTRIGVDGFGFVQQAGKHLKVPQIGYVLIEDDVELFCNITIARGTLGATVIGSGSKIDCLDHIAHNCKIGKDCAFAGVVALAGSVTLKDRVFVGGLVGFNNQVVVGENTIIMGESCVTKDIPPNSVVSGFPAQDHRQEMAFQAALRRLVKKPK